MQAPAIFLIGFMGAGKTTLGKKLAARLKYRFVDLDGEVIAQYHCATVAALIDERGIDFFREAESRTLRTMNLQNTVVSTGGGTPCYYDNMDWIKRSGVVVFLEVDEKSLFNRLKTTPLHERPLLRNLNDEGLMNFIHEKIQERMPYYSQAHIVFNPVKHNLATLIEILGKFAW